MKFIVVTETDGVIKMTKEEFQKYIDEAYWEGYREGKNAPWWCRNGDIITIPSVPNVHDIITTCKVEL